MNRPNKISYIEYDIQLLSCVDDPEAFKAELMGWMKERLNPDIDSDIVIDIGIHTPIFKEST